MPIYRYNIVSNSNHEITVNPKWKISVQEQDPNTTVNCIHCGRSMPFKDSYESKRYTNENSKHYRECKECYDTYENIYKLRAIR